MNYFVGIDGGGSHTRAVVTDESLRVCGRGEGAPGNHYRVGAAAAARNCIAAAQAAIEDAGRIVPGLEDSAIAMWGLGLAGLRRAADVAVMRAELMAPMAGNPFVLDTDVAAAHSGAFAGGPGIVLIAGTGAIALGIDGEGEQFFVDGLGTLLGDEGSGYWIGLEALRAVCRAADGRAPRTTLLAPVLDALNVADLDALVRYVYSPECTPSTVARLARIVIDAATAGGHVAIDIRDRAVMRLVASVAAVARQYLQAAQARAIQQAPTPCDLSIALCGGLFEDDFFRASVGYQIGERMIELKRDFLPLGTWRVVKPQHDAAIGAALLARRFVEN